MLEQVLCYIMWLGELSQRKEEENSTVYHYFNPICVIPEEEATTAKNQLQIAQIGPPYYKYYNYAMPK